MTQFIQLHLLTAYPPSNLNRDDSGAPKTAIVGGTTRLRVSSQSLKRAWRTSEIFESALSEHQGTRTKKIGEEVSARLQQKGVAEKQAIEWASLIASCFGKIKKENKIEIEQLAHISPEELNGIMSLADTLASENRGPEDDELKLLRVKPRATDIAMFGRMLASSPIHNVEAAVQVAHAITVNQTETETDFFTAVDDLNRHEEDSGAAHMGDAGFGSGIYYLYLCINKDLLISNLNQGNESGDPELANKALAALVESAAKIAPTGKQNSFASRAYTSYILAEKGDKQPRSLSVSYLKAVRGDDPLKQAIAAIESQKQKFDNVYGSCADADKTLNAHNDGSETCTLQDIIDFVTE